MGLFRWFKRTPKAPAVTKAGWIHDQILTHTKNGDVEALVEASASLGFAGMVFGMVVGDLPEREELREEALEALRAMLPKIADESCEAVFEVVTRARLPINIEPRRKLLLAARKEANDRAFAERREALASCHIAALVEACDALLNFGGQVVHGVDFRGTEEERLALLGPALARLRALIPTLPDDECTDIYAAIRRARLPIDVSAKSSELVERRRVDIERAIHWAGTEPRNEALERTIAANPDDPDAYAVLADWLQQQSHPRGELIALQLRAESDPSLQAAVDGLMMDHTSALLGPLLLHRRTHDGTRREAFTWRRGFIDHARLSSEYQQNRPVRLTGILELLLAHPSGRLLAGVDVGINGMSDASLDDVVELLVARAPTTLRTLLLGDFTQEQSEVSDFNVGNLAPLWRPLRGLRKLVVHGGSFELGTIEHTLLEHAEFKTGGLSNASADAIATARWPRLRHLDVWYGDPNYGGPASIDAVRPLLARADLTDLVHLGLMNAAFTDDICEALPGAELARQLRELDLSLGTMSDAGALALAKAGAFPKLTRLDVSSNYLTDDAIAALKDAFPEVVAADQREPGDGRYPSVGE